MSNKKFKIESFFRINEGLSAEEVNRLDVGNVVIDDSLISFTIADIERDDDGNVQFVRLKSTETPDSEFENPETNRTKVSAEQLKRFELD